MPSYKVQSPDGVKFKVSGDSPPTERELNEIFETMTPAAPAAASPATGRFAESTFTPTQLGALNVAVGPLASLIGSQLSGRPVTAAEAAAEGGLEALGKMPGELATLALQGGVPPPVRLMAGLGETLGVLPANSLNSLISRLVSPAVQAPTQIANALNIEQGPERAKFREPGFAAGGEIGVSILNPVVEETKVAETAGRLPSAIRNAVENMSARGITRAPLEDAVTRATGITAQEGSLEILPLIKTEVLKVGPRPQTAKTALEAGGKAADNLIGKALNGMQKAESQGLAFAGDSAIDAGRQGILFEFPSSTPESIDGVLSEFAYLRGNIAPTKGQGFLRELNSKYLGLENKNSPEAAAYRAVRSALSDQLDDVYKAATGVNDSPYRQWGQLQDFLKGVDEQIIGAQRTQGGKAERGATRVPLTGGRMKRAAESIGLRSLIPREIEAVDKGIQRIFSSEVSNLPKPAKLSQSELQALRDKYLAKPPAQTPPIPETATVAPNLEQQIEALIRTYPLNLRRDPALARLAAQSELGVVP